MLGCHNSMLFFFFNMCTVLGETVLLGSLVLLLLVGVGGKVAPRRQDPNCSFTETISQDYLTQLVNLRDKLTSSFRSRADLFSVCYKSSGDFKLSAPSLQLKPTLCVASPGSHRDTSMGHGGIGEQHKHVDVPAVCYAVSNKPFISGGKNDQTHFLQISKGIVKAK